MSFGRIPVPDLGQQAEMRRMQAAQQIQNRLNTVYTCAQNCFIIGFQELVADTLMRATVSDESEESRPLEISSHKLHELAVLSISAAKLFQTVTKDDIAVYAKKIEEEIKRDERTKV